MTGVEVRRSVVAGITLFASLCFTLLGSALADDRDDHSQGSDDQARDDDWGHWLTHINPRFMISPQEALKWAKFKSNLGPTYGGSSGSQQWLNFIETTMQEFGAIDLFYQDMPYSRYVVNDWPDPKTHIYGSGVEVEKLISNGTPVPVVASYGMTSGFTPASGVTAPMLYYDPNNPPTAAQIAGKILVFQTVPYPAAVPGSNAPYDYSTSTLAAYAYTDYLYETPGEWYQKYVPVPASVSSSYHSRWVWNQLGGFSTIGMNKGAAPAAGMVVVYDYSPAAASASSSAPCTA